MQSLVAHDPPPSTSSASPRPAFLSSSRAKNGSPPLDPAPPSPAFVPGLGHSPGYGTRLQDQVDRCPRVDAPSRTRKREGGLSVSSFSESRNRTKPKAPLDLTRPVAQIRTHARAHLDFRRSRLYQPYLIPLRSEVSSRWCEFCSFNTGREQGRKQYFELQG